MPSSKPATVLWFHNDLRLDDHPALAEAVRCGAPVVPVYIWAPHEEGAWAPGGASRWWLHHALEDLDRRLRELGGRLWVLDARRRDSLAVLRELVAEIGAGAVYWSRRYEPHLVERDTEVKTALRAEGLDAVSFGGCLLTEPTQVRNKSGSPFKVFTPFWKHLQGIKLAAPAPVELSDLHLARVDPSAAVELEQLGLLPKLGWGSGFAPFWGGEPARAGGERRLGRFLESGSAVRYSDRRDLPGSDGTSMLSPYLHFGQIGVRELWHRFGDASADGGGELQGGVMRQLVWREFAHHLLFHFPETATRPLRPEFERFPWSSDEAALGRWQRGETGYPIVDAGMRQLWETGWMHNRVRMVVASFLVKHLLCDWADGARWFWDTLVDADLANNTFGWQWSAGCGADAAPYFRVFNPMAQGEKFDADGAYVKRYLPELSAVPEKFVHRPWEMGELELAGCGVTLGKDYPAPMVEHSSARKRALDAFASIRGDG